MHDIIVCSLKAGKRWQLRCIATWGRPTSLQSFWVFITTPTMYQRIRFQHSRTTAHWVIENFTNFPWESYFVNL